MTDLPKPCIVCGEPCQTGRCPEHPVKDTRRRPSRSAGYDTAWDRTRPVPWQVGHGGATSTLPA